MIPAMPTRVGLCACRGFVTAREGEREGGGRAEDCPASVEAAERPACKRSSPRRSCSVLTSVSSAARCVVSPEIVVSRELSCAMRSVR